ncbi:MBOAT family O-acyltransferase [Butyrivibrio sp. MC2013]|uniref:MBOAT family O-acyltransferase n=1 Tax=Butyrivibrio sp. MC2013 TaxID=1280686 RepID=UPI00041883D3|nr:MBOAT family O-acyltransferase [Butyrivibrio sp. MC2013]
MLFNSYIFIFAFLPAAVIGYYLLAKVNRLLPEVYLLLMSLCFYGYFNPAYLLIICGSIVGNYLISGILSRKQDKLILVLGIVANTAVIFYFKYFNFIKETINGIFHLDLMITDIVLPLGISFFTFQQISFLVDSYKGECKDYSFVEYALFVSFFPQLIAGPIVLHRETIPQFRDPLRKKVDFDNIYSGIVLFTLGLAKKVILADTFARCVTWAFDGNVDTLTSPEIFIIMLSYTFQIYFDFSAYSDMACGIGRIFNIAIPMNFNSPYKSYSIPEFWGRWHMTLGRFLKEYIYIPLGGSRKGQARTYRNIMLIFLVSGIWHGANWTFILWGILHGVANCLTRVFRKQYDRMHMAFQWFITFAYVSILWLLFRADSIRQWVRLLLRMFKMETFTVRKEIIDSFSLPERGFVFDLFHLRGLAGKIPFICPLLFFAFAFVVCLNHRNSVEKKFHANVLTTVFTALLLAYAVISVGGVSVFIYFNF